MTKYEKMYAVLRYLKQTNKPVGDRFPMKRFEYYKSIPFDVHLYPKNQEMVTNGICNDSTDYNKKILVINLDFVDFIQGFYFLNEIVTHCNSKKYWLDALSQLKYKNLEYELGMSSFDTDINYGQIFQYSMDTDIWKKRLAQFDLSSYDTVIFNGINYYLFYCIYHGLLKGKQVNIYEPHLLNGKKDLRDVNKVSIKNFVRDNTVRIFADAEDTKYYVKMGFPESCIIKHRHVIHDHVMQLSGSIQTIAEPYIFSGGSEGRDFESLLEAIQGTGYKLVLCTDKTIADNAGVSCLGRVAFNEYVDVIKNASAVVLPLYRNGSGIITTVLAMAASRPIIITKTQTSPIYITHDHNGMFVPMRDTDQLRKSLCDIMGDKAKAEQLGCEAYNFYNNNCRMGDLAAKMVE